jgi:hypothetical protein
MNGREIRDALSSAFLDAELGVRVVHAKATDSIYLTANDGKLPYTVRIANHNSSRQYTKVHDYWIDTTKDDIPRFINAAIQGAAKRFGIEMPEYVPKVVMPEVVEDASEKPVQISDTYAIQPPLNLIDLATFYVNEGFMLPEQDNSPEPCRAAKKKDNKIVWYLWAVGLILVLYYCLH